MDEGLAHDEIEDLEEAWKDLMELMADDSKPRFTNILWRLPNLGQLIWRKYEFNILLILFLNSLKITQVSSNKSHASFYHMPRIMRCGAQLFFATHIF